MWSQLVATGAGSPVPNRHSANGGNMNECPVMALAMTAESVLGWPLQARGVICPRAMDRGSCNAHGSFDITRWSA
jgi:hypothetical protein